MNGWVEGIVGIVGIRGIGNMQLSIHMSMRRSRLDDSGLRLRCHSWRWLDNLLRSRKRVIRVGNGSTTSKTITSVTMCMLMRMVPNIRGASSYLGGRARYILRRSGFTVRNRGMTYRIRSIRVGR